MKEDMKAWEDNRDKRVESWRQFTDKKTKIERKKKTHFGIKAPVPKAEERPDYARIDIIGGLTMNKPMGMNEDYKK